MQDGEIGLYPGEDRVIYANLRSGDKGIPFENLLPETMRDDAFNQSRVADYTQVVFLYLTTQSQWREWNQSASSEIAKAKGKKVHLQTPPLDLRALKLLNADRKIDYHRVVELFALIAPYHEAKPPIGVVAEMIKRKYADQEIDQVLSFHAHHDGKAPNGFDQCFLEIFIPPEIDGTDKRIRTKAIEYAMAWCRRPSDEPGLKQDNLYWNLNFQELGITKPDGSLDYTMAGHARHFIWCDESRAPDYFLLRDYLQQFSPKPLPVKKPSSIPKAYRDKLKKQKRNKGRVRRRR